MIRLNIVSYNSESPPEPLSATFGIDGGTLGRSKDNDMVLADPKRYVSRRQALVSSNGNRHTIVNLSLTNPIMVNDRELEANREMTLQVGDRLIIGLFVMHVEAVADDIVTNQTSDQTSVHTAVSDATARLAGDASHFNGAELLAGTALENCTSARQTMESEGAGLAALLASLGTSVSSPAQQDKIPQVNGAIGAEVISETAVLSSPPPASIEEPLTHSARVGMAISFDDLLHGSPHGAALPEYGAPRIPDSFDPFDLPSQAVRNSDDPLAELVQNNVTLASFEDRIIGSLVASASGAKIESFLHTDLEAAHVDPMKLFSTEAILPVQETGFETSRIVSDHVREIDAPFLLPVKRGAMQNDDSIDLAELGRSAAAEPNTSDTPGMSSSVGQHGFSSDRASMPAAVVETIGAMSIGALGNLGLHCREPNLSEPKFEPADTRELESSGTLIGRAATDASLIHQPVAADPLTHSERQMLMQAFIEGANIPDGTINGNLTPEIMRTIGQILASAMQGTVELVASRAMVKREVKADVTMIIARNNNPLKFLPDGQTALMHMFGRKIPGFMDPVEAIDDAYQDLRAHQIGVVAGMRAALNDVLHRFDPVQMDARCGDRSLIDSVLPMHRKARMWERYNDLFQQIQAESQDDFQALFGKAFLLAYDEEIARFEQEGT